MSQPSTSMQNGHNASTAPAPSIGSAPQPQPTGQQQPQERRLHPLSYTRKDTPPEPKPTGQPQQQQQPQERRLHPLSYSRKDTPPAPKPTGQPQPQERNLHPLSYTRDDSAPEPQPTGQPQPQQERKLHPLSYTRKVETGTYYSQPPQATGQPGAPRPSQPQQHGPASRYGPPSGVLSSKLHPLQLTANFGPRPNPPPNPKPTSQPPPRTFPGGGSILNAQASGPKPPGQTAPSSRPLAPIPGNPTYQRTGSGPHLPQKPQEAKNPPNPTARSHPTPSQAPSTGTDPPTGSCQPLAAAVQAASVAASHGASGAGAQPAPPQPRPEPQKSQRISDLIVPTAGDPGPIELLAHAQPGEVPVVCGGNRGRFLMAANQMACQCSKCVEQAKAAGTPYTVMAMGEFEKHSRAPPPCCFGSG